VSIGCGRKRRSVRALRWICGVKPPPKAGNKPWQHCIVHGLAKPGSSATVSLFGNEGGSHDPAVIVFFPQIPIEPVATRASLIDKDEVFGFRLHLADELIAVALTCPNGSQVSHLSAMVLGDIRHGNRIFVDIHSNEECARLRHG
jgi:hypothetical protein